MLHELGGFLHGLCVIAEEKGNHTLNSMVGLASVRKSGYCVG